MIDCNITTNYFSEKQRMTKRYKMDGGGYACKLLCTVCPLSGSNSGSKMYCSDFESIYPEKAIAIIQEWSNEHPLKTYLSELLKNYPNIQLRNDGTPEGNLCPYQLGLMSVGDCRKHHNCVECWNQVIPSKE